MGKSFAITNLAPTPERDQDAALSGPRRGVGAQIRRLAGLAAFALRFFVLRQKGPFFLAVVTNDSCNLNCIDCRIANTEYRSLSYDEVCAILERSYRRGVRFVTFTGGEPYLWRDGARRLGDLVRLAHDFGYLHVNIFTNGTIPLRAGADFTYVSIDGVDEVYRKVRGIPLSRILRNIRPFTGRFAVIHTVNTVNYRDIPAFLDFIRAELPGIRVLFFFHTPYYGVDALRLSPDQRREVVEMLLAKKAEGYPVYNSKAGLRAYLKGFPGLPSKHCVVVDRTGDADCCRAIGNPEVCAECGYAVNGELVEAQNWRLGAIWSLMRAT